MCINTSYGHEGFPFDQRKCLGTVVRDLPRHRHSDPRLSVSFQSQTRWMAGEWKSWLKPNPNTFASFHPVGQKGRKGDRHSRPALRSRIIPFRVFCALKYKYDGGKEIENLLFLLPLPSIFDASRNFPSRFSSFFRAIEKFRIPMMGIRERFNF